MLLPYHLRVYDAHKLEIERRNSDLEYFNESTYTRSY